MFIWFWNTAKIVGSVGIGQIVRIREWGPKNAVKSVVFCQTFVTLDQASALYVLSVLYKLAWLTELRMCIVLIACIVSNVCIAWLVQIVYKYIVLIQSCDIQRNI